MTGFLFRDEEFPAAAQVLNMSDKSFSSFYILPPVQSSISYSSQSFFLSSLSLGGPFNIQYGGRNIFQIRPRARKSYASVILTRNYKHTTIIISSREIGTFFLFPFSFIFFFLSFYYFTFSPSVKIIFLSQSFCFLFFRILFVNVMFFSQTQSPFSFSFFFLLFSANKEERREE